MAARDRRVIEDDVAVVATADHELSARRELDDGEDRVDAREEDALAGMQPSDDVRRQLS